MNYYASKDGFTLHFCEIPRKYIYSIQNKINGN